MFSRSDFDIFDRNVDPALDELTELAARLSGADYAYTGWMDFNRLWFKSRFGFSAVEQPRSASACQWVAETGAPLIIADASEDNRFPREGIRIAHETFCRSYAGVPLRADNGEVLGTLAVLSRDPAQFSANNVPLLESLGRQVMTRFELYRRIRAQEDAQRARLRAERALAVERSFVTAALDSIPSLVAVLDTAGRVVRFNQPCAQLTGWPLSDAAGRNFFDRVLAEDKDRRMAAGLLTDAGMGRFSGPHESVWKAAGGFTRTVSWSLRPFNGTNGEIQYVIIGGLDITEQRDAESALETMESRFRHVVESSLGFVFTCTPEGRFLSLSSHASEMLGYRIEEIAGRPVADLLDPGAALTFQESLHALRNGGEWQGKLRMRRRDGRVRHIGFRSRRMESRGERPFLLHHGTDVTEQHELEEALHRATRQREHILDAMGEGIFGIGVDGRVSFINQAAMHALGFGAGRIEGREILELIRHSSSENIAYTWQNNPIVHAMRRGEILRMEDEIFWHADGTPISVDYTANPLRDDGHVTGMVIAFRDVSERQQLEKMKDEFISTVSHELRTPLTSLRASLGLLSAGALAKQPERQRQMTEMAIENCDRLVRLVNGIVDFDRSQRGRMALRRAPVQALDLLRRAVDLAQAAADDGQISFRIEAHTEFVLADEDRVLQVLNELISNAIRFSSPKGLIRLSATPEGDGEICFVVEDQGPGISARQLERIFDRFHQGDASDTRALGGTGLGLALCKQIVEQHGGRIWAESVLGRGSRFLFTLGRAAREDG